jgi:hypothetical protein
LPKDQIVKEQKIELLTDKEYTCAPDGQVMLLPGARSVYDLNEEYENELFLRRQSSWAAKDTATLLDEVRRLAGIRRLEQLPKPRVEIVDTVARSGYTIKKLVIQPEEGIVLPALLFLPEKSNGEPVVLYLHDKGKVADAGDQGPIGERVRGGGTVLAVDPRGYGQTASTTGGLFGADFQDAQLAYVLGRSIVGMRAEDILVCARYASELDANGGKGAIDLVAIGNIGIPSLHAAALEPALFRNVKLKRMLVSWANVIHTRLNTPGVVADIVHGALPSYDLPELESTLGKNLTIEEPLNVMDNFLRKGKYYFYP